MTERLILHGQYGQPVSPVRDNSIPARKQGDVRQPFERLLENELRQAQEVKFSRHAQERLDARKITLEKQQIKRLSDAVSRAESKGCRESLVLLDDLAFVVSVKNRMVITAVDGDSRKDSVFTNIDSAVIN